MVLIRATSFLLASHAAYAKLNSLPNEANPQSKSVAGLRELQRLANSKDRGLFGDHFAGFGDSFEETIENIFELGSGGDPEETTGNLLSGLSNGGDCDETCADSSKCASFMGMPPSASGLQDLCDAGCIPQVALSICSNCEDDTGADATITSVQRLNLFDFSPDLLCGNCEFYKCCIAEGSSFESCQENLPDMDDFTDLASTIPGLGEITDSLLPDLGEMPDWDAPFPGGLDVGDFPDMSSLVPDWDAASIGSESDSVFPFFGQLVGSVDCPKTCDNKELCESVFMGVRVMGDQTLEDACNEGCLPLVSASFCEDTCGNVDGQEFLGSVVDVACDSCKFVECCAKDQSDDDNKFDTCKEFLPIMGNLLPDIEWDTFPTTDWNYTWGTDLDWSGLEVASGLSEIVENIHSLFDQALGDFDAFPVTCNSETCPVDGLCDNSINFSGVDLEDVCENSAFFKCAEGLEDMCANECGSASLGVTRSSNFLSTSFCSLCNMAECCKEKDNGTSFEECASLAVPQEISGVIEDMTDVIDIITNAFGQLSTLIEEVVFDPSIPDFCPEVDSAECPITGLCNVFSRKSTNFDLESIEYEGMCNDNALFLCGPEGFEGMCTDKCSSGTGSGIDYFLDDAFCSLCNIAMCCKGKDAAKTFEDCAFGALPQEIDDAIKDVADADEDSSGFSSDVPNKESPSESSASPAGDSGFESLDDPIIVAAALPELAPEDFLGDPTDTTASVSPVEGAVSDQFDASAVPVGSSLEVPQFKETIESGAYVSQVSMLVGLAFVTTLFFVSF